MAFELRSKVASVLNALVHEMQEKLRACEALDDVTRLHGLARAAAQSTVEHHSQLSALGVDQVVNFSVWALSNVSLRNNETR